MSDESAADFMRDQLEALLASPVLARVAQRHGETGDSTATGEESHSDSEDEPNPDDVESLRAALQKGLK